MMKKKLQKIIVSGLKDEPTFNTSQTYLITY